MAKQLHKKFPDEQVKSLLQNYLTHEIELPYILDILGIKRRRFFYLLKKYQEDPEHFSIAYSRKQIGKYLGVPYMQNFEAIG